MHDPRRPPATLAEYRARPGHKCPIPATHDRADECHYWWHEIARNYHEPDPLRYSLGAFIQASRNVTFMLQSEKRIFKDFDWYETTWRDHSKGTPALGWIEEHRTEVVHRSVLVPGSWFDFRCLRDADDPLRDEDEDATAYPMTSFECTHALFLASAAAVDAIEGENHDHEIERHWEVDAFPRVELLELCAQIYGELQLLNITAHEKAGSSIASNYEGGRPPCMMDTLEHRVARFERQHGTDIWINEPPGLHP